MGAAFWVRARTRQCFRPIIMSEMGAQGNAGPVVTWTLLTRCPALVPILERALAPMRLFVTCKVIVMTCVAQGYTTRKKDNSATPSQFSSPRVTNSSGRKSGSKMREAPDTRVNLGHVQAPLFLSPTSAEQKYHRTGKRVAHLQRSLQVAAVKATGKGQSIRSSAGRNSAHRVAQWRAVYLERATCAPIILQLNVPLRDHAKIQD